MPNTIYAALDHSGCPFWRRAFPCSGTEAEDGRTDNRYLGRLRGVFSLPRPSRLSPKLSLPAEADQGWLSLL